ncbi:MAG: DUF2239 family protein [Candidatus Krumholzibacteriia bacterium]
MSATPILIAFAGTSRLSEGAPGDVARAVRRPLAAGGPAPVCILDARTSAAVDLAMGGTADQVAEWAEARFAAQAEAAGQKSRGRPRLGVVAREVTLLPRHWDWLAAQPGGASVTLRKLVDAARKRGGPGEHIRRTQDVVHRFLYTVAGDLPGFEEVARALYAWDRPALDARLAAWPADVVAHAHTLLAQADQGPPLVPAPDANESLSCRTRL